MVIMLKVPDPPEKEEHLQQSGSQYWYGLLKIVNGEIEKTQALELDGSCFLHLSLFINISS